MTAEATAPREADAELDAATIHDPLTRLAYGVCADWLAHRDSSAPHLWLRARLPIAARPYWDALLAFTGYADDLADDPALDIDGRRRQFDRFLQDFLRMLHHPGRPEPLRAPAPGDPEFALCLAFRDLVLTWHIAEESLMTASQAVGRDIEVPAYATQAELERYLHGACAQPMLWLGTVLGLVRDGDRLGAFAWGLGLGLLDTLADLPEDVRIGKLYLPLDDLGRLGLRPADVERAVADRHATEPLRRLIRRQARRCLRHFAAAEAWAQGTRAPEADVVLRSIGRARQSIDQLERAGHDVFALP